MEVQNLNYASDTTESGRKLGRIDRGQQQLLNCDPVLVLIAQEPTVGSDGGSPDNGWIIYYPTIDVVTTLVPYCEA